MPEQSREPVVSVFVTEQVITEKDAISSNDAGVGATLTFSGVVRDNNEDRHVVAIEYECYERLVTSETRRIVMDAAERFPIRYVVVVYRIGKILVGQTSLVVSVGTAHRADGFNVVKEIVDHIKSRVPVWKHEFYADGTSRWL